MVNNTYQKVEAEFDKIFDFILLCALQQFCSDFWSDLSGFSFEQIMYTFLTISIFA